MRKRVWVLRVDEPMDDSYVLPHWWGRLLLLKRGAPSRPLGRSGWILGGGNGKMGGHLSPALERERDKEQV